MMDRFSFRRGHRSRAIFLICDYAFQVILMVMIMIPLWKIFVDSVDPSSVGTRLFPKEISFTAYKVILSNPSMYRPFFISVLTTVVGTVLGLSITTLGAYALSKKNLPGNKVFGRIILITMMFDGGMIATYLTYKNLGLMNNLLAVMLPVCTTAYNTILMRSFFEGLPQSLFEAASIDGCGSFGSFMRIALPLSKPVLASVGLFIAVSMWNNYMSFILYITDANLQNFQVKIRSLILEESLISSSTSQNVASETLKSATVIVVIIPFLFVYPFLQKYFTKGVTLGAIKG